MIEFLSFYLFLLFLKLLGAPLLLLIIIGFMYLLFRIYLHLIGQIHQLADVNFQQQLQILYLNRRNAAFRRQVQMGLIHFIHYMANQPRRLAQRVQRAVKKNAPKKKQN